MRPKLGFNNFGKKIRRSMDDGAVDSAPWYTDGRVCRTYYWTFVEKSRFQTISFRIRFKVITKVFHVHTHTHIYTYTNRTVSAGFYFLRCNLARISHDDVVYRVEVKQDLFRRYYFFFYKSLRIIYICILYITHLTAHIIIVVTRIFFSSPVFHKENRLSWIICYIYICMRKY